MIHTHMDNLGERSRLFEVVRLLARQIASTSDLAEVLSTAAQTVREHLGYEQVAIYLAEPDTGDLTLCAVAVAEPSQIPSAQYHLPRGEGTPGQAVAQGKGVRLDDAHAHPALGLAATAVELSVPIWEGTQPIGVLTAASSRPASLSAVDEDVLTLLADQLAAAIRSAQLSRREAERAGREELLTHISRAVNSSLDLGEVLQQAVVKVGTALKADRCTLGQIDLTARVLMTRHEYVSPLLNERRSLKGQMALEASLAGLAQQLQAGEVIISTEAKIHPVLRDVWEEFSRRYGIRSLVWVPILGQSPDRSYSLALAQVTHARRWSDADIALLRAIADQLALALHNARLFDAVQQSALELRAKNAELESFVYTVSHDLQAPVVSLRGFASLLQSRYRAQLDERGHTYVERIAANADFLSRLLQDLLELSRVGRLEAPDETVPVKEIVEQVLGDLAQPVAERRVQLELPEAWPVVTYSRTRLRQVFSNLLSNAIKFMGRQPGPRICLGWQRRAGTPVVKPRKVLGGREANRPSPPPDEIEFFVQDNGIGIHPDYHQRIFSPFQRLKMLDVDGTGVGLSIVKRIVEGRGGRIRVESAPGAGATFYFTVPALSGPRDEESSHGDDRNGIAGDRDADRRQPGSRAADAVRAGVVSARPAGDGDRRRRAGFELRPG